MDLSRWGFDRLLRLSNRYRNLKTFLAEILDGERSLVEGESPAQIEEAFEVRDGFETIEAPYKLRDQDRVGAVFRALAPCFEAGFLVRRCLKTAGESEAVELESMFVFGRVFTPSSEEVPRYEMKLPIFDPERVFRGRAPAVLAPFRLDRVSRLSDASAFAFAPQPGVYIVLICGRPHLWQIAAIEATVKRVRGLLKDSSVEPARTSRRGKGSGK